MPCRRPLGVGPLCFGVHPVVRFFRRYKIWRQIVVVVNGLLGYEFRFAKTWGIESRRSVARRCGSLGGCMVGSVYRTVWLGWTCREGRFLGLCCAIESGRRNGADIENWCAWSLCRRCPWGRQRTSRLWWFRIIIHVDLLVVSQGYLRVSKLVVPQGAIDMRMSVKRSRLIRVSLSQMMEDQCPLVLDFTGSFVCLSSLFRTGTKEGRSCVGLNVSLTSPVLLCTKDYCTTFTTNLPVVFPPVKSRCAFCTPSAVNGYSSNTAILSAPFATSSNNLWL